MHDDECVPSGSVYQWRLVRGMRLELRHLHGFGRLFDVPGPAVQVGRLYQPVHDDECVPSGSVYQWRLVRGMRLELRHLRGFGRLFDVPG